MTHFYILSIGFVENKTLFFHRRSAAVNYYYDHCSGMSDVYIYKVYCFNRFIELNFEDGD